MGVSKFEQHSHRYILGMGGHSTDKNRRPTYVQIVFHNLINASAQVEIPKETQFEHLLEASSAIKEADQRLSKIIEFPNLLSASWQSSLWKRDGIQATNDLPNSSIPMEAIKKDRPDLGLTQNTIIDEPLQQPMAKRQSQTLLNKSHGAVNPTKVTRFWRNCF